MTATADLLRAILWPGVVVVAMLVFKAPISDLIGRIKAVSYGDAKVEIAAKVAGIADVSHKLPTDEPNARPRRLVRKPSRRRIIDNPDDDSALVTLAPPPPLSEVTLPRSEHRPAEPDDARWGPIELRAFTQPADAVIDAFQTLRRTMADIAGDKEAAGHQRPWQERVAQLEVNGLLTPQLADVLRRTGQVFDEVSANPRASDSSSAITFVAAAKNIDRSLIRTSVNLQAARRLAAAVHDRREVLGLARAQLAESADTDEQTITNLEAGTMYDVRSHIDLHRIDDALRWSTGSAELLLVDGRTPTPVE